ncbi:DUF4238 domain-containing protein [Dyella sp. C11]|uniref:DUF4238 domain-containing protein n=1 Tax=Dyella sp. C11 TaxID=2126991 RepID=UPI000D652086|nr:DUF4238 domain-containing protein [Dyella sp. C11]
MASLNSVEAASNANFPSRHALGTTTPAHKNTAIDGLIGSIFLQVLPPMRARRFISTRLGWVLNGEMMSNKSRGHHYLSQCYLKGFTADGARTSRLAVIDGKERKAFRTVPENVAKVRDFNRLNAEGFDPNALEQKLSELESKVAEAIAELERGAPFQDERREVVLSLAAIFAIRNPHKREVWRQNMANLMDRVMDTALHSKEMWQRQIDAAREDGQRVDDGVTYEQMKDFHERKEYRIELSNDRHIEMEFVGLDAVLPYFLSRGWSLFRNSDDDAPFITSETPVTVMWTDGGEGRFPLGYALRGTSVCFPVSRNLYLIGRFDDSDTDQQVDDIFVAFANESTIAHAQGRLFAPSYDFRFTTHENKILDGRSLLASLSITEPR